jgi:class 3 adenylate cyclase
LPVQFVLATHRGPNDRAALERALLTHNAAPTLCDWLATRENRLVTDLPRGTVTLLFTDIEGSTQLQHRVGERYQEVVREHRRLLEAAFAEHGGVVVDRQTESFFVVFTRARHATQAAADAQRTLEEHEWPDGVEVRVRMGIHSGDPDVEGDRYVGLAVSRAARVCASAHGGQVLLSSSARALLSDHDRTHLRRLGAYQLKDFAEPEPISQLVVDGLPSQFPPLRTGAAPSRRKWLLAAAAVFLAGATAGAVVALAGGGSSVTVGPTDLAVIDPDSSKVVETIDLGFNSNLIAAGEDYVWVVDPTGSTLRKIDPHERAVAGVFSLSAGAGEVPYGLAVGSGAVWVAVLRGSRQFVLEFGPDHGDLRSTIPYGEEIGGGAYLDRLSGLTFGGGAVWAIDAAVGGLWRIDPRTGRPRKLADGLDALSLAAGGGAVWVAGSGGVTKLDASTGLELGYASVGSQTVSETTAIALGADAAWATGSALQTLAKVDEETVGTTETFEVGRGPSGVAVGHGAVWVAAGRDGSVTRIDVEGGAPSTIELGSPPGGIVAAYDAVWTSPGELRG